MDELSSLFKMIADNGMGIISFGILIYLMWTVTQEMKTAIREGVPKFLSLFTELVIATKDNGIKLDELLRLFKENLDSKNKPC